MPTDVGACDCTRGLYGHRIQSALEVDSGRKIACHTGDSSPRSYCAWFFSGTLYQLSDPGPGVGGRSNVYEADFVGRQF